MHDSLEGLSKTVNDFQNKSIIFENLSSSRIDNDPREKLAAAAENRELVEAMRTIKDFNKETIVTDIKGELQRKISDGLQKLEDTVNSSIDERLKAYRQ